MRYGAALKSFARTFAPTVPRNDSQTDVTKYQPDLFFNWKTFEIVSLFEFDLFHSSLEAF